MTAALTVLCVLCALCGVMSAIFATAARKAADKAAADVVRMDAIVNGLLTITPHGPDPEWTVEHLGAVVARGYDLRVLLDEVNVYG